MENNNGSHSLPGADTLTSSRAETDEMVAAIVNLVNERMGCKIPPDCDGMLMFFFKDTDDDAIAASTVGGGKINIDRLEAVVAALTDVAQRMVLAGIADNLGLSIE